MLSARLRRNYLSLTIHLLLGLGCIPAGETHDKSRLCSLAARGQENSQEENEGKE